MIYGLSNAHVTDDVTCDLRRCCEAVRSAILATASLPSCRDIALYANWDHEFDLLRSRDVIDHVITFDTPFAISYWWSFGIKPQRRM